MDSKNILASKTAWGAVLTPIFAWLAAKYGFELDGETQAAIVGFACAIIGIVLRLVTDSPAHVVKPKE